MNIDNERTEHRIADCQKCKQVQSVDAFSMNAIDRKRQAFIESMREENDEPKSNSREDLGYGK